MSRRLKLFLAMLACFLLGGICGIAWTAHLVETRIFQIMTRGPDELHRQVVRRISKRLSLTEPQQRALEPIAARMNADLLELRNQVSPEIERIIANGAAQLRPHLDARQQATLDDMIRNRRTFWLQLEKSRLQAPPTSTEPAPAAVGDDKTP